MQSMTLNEFHAAIKAQGLPPNHWAFRCPACGTVQSATDLINAGAGASMGEVEKYLGFSCYGRFTGAGAPRKKPDGKPCNWTLGGLFQIHRLEVLTPDGERHPRFEVATSDEAQAHMCDASVTKEEA